jgi:hypothetical protein
VNAILVVGYLAVDEHRRTREQLRFGGGELVFGVEKDIFCRTEQQQDPSGKVV